MVHKNRYKIILALAPVFLLISLLWFTSIPAGAAEMTIGSSPLEAVPTGINYTSNEVTATSGNVTIASFAPAVGNAGTQVVITGTNFTAIISITVAGVPVASYTVNSSNQITAAVAGAVAGTTGPVVVTTSDGSATSTSNFTYTNPPTITSFTPNSGYAGVQVIIGGTNLTGATSVTIAGVAASITEVSATQITATVGNGTVGVSGVITVITPNGTASSSGAFTYINTSAPTISQFTPTSGSSGTQVTIYGTNLSGVTSVNFGAYPVSQIVSAYATQLIVTVGAGVNGNVYITVATTGGTATSSTQFFYSGSTGTLPTISSLSTTTGSYGTNILIYGNNLNYTTGVFFGGTAASSYAIYSTYISAVVGYGSSGYVTLTSQGGTATSASYFTYTGGSTGYTPTITSISTISGSYGTTVYIYGTNLNYATGVYFGGTAAQSYSINSANQITAVVAYGSTGYVTITSQYGTGTSTTYFTYTGTTGYTPTITSISMSSGSNGTTVYIYGTNLNYATAVYFGGTSAQSYSINSSTQITAVVGYGSSGYVTITSAYGTGTSTTYFTYSGSTGNTPTITSLSTNSGIYGTTVYIYGTNLSYATAVYFGGTAAQNYSINSATQITAVVGYGSSGYVTISSSYGTATSSTYFTYTGTATTSPPTITSFTPTSGYTGASIVITGTGFSNASAVSFGGVAAQTYTVDSATQITAKVGAGASGNVNVTNSYGYGTLTGFTFVEASNTSLSDKVDSTGKFNTSVTATSTDNKASVTIAKDTTGKLSSAALSQITISQIDTALVSAVPTGLYLATTSAYDFGPSGAKFDKAVQMTMAYDATLIPAGATENSLFIAWWDAANSKWVSLTSTVDATNKKITASTDHFTTFVAMATTLKAQFGVSSLQISPKQVQTGKPVNISVILGNQGSATGSYDVKFNINGSLAKTIRVEQMPGGASQNVTFSYTPATPGTYTAEVDYLNDKFIVTAAATTTTPPAVTTTTPATTTVKPTTTTTAVTTTPATTTKPVTTTVATTSGNTTGTGTGGGVNWWLIGGVIIIFLIIVWIVYRVIIYRRKSIK